MCACSTAGPPELEAIGGEAKDNEEAELGEADAAEGDAAKESAAGKDPGGEAFTSNSGLCEPRALAAGPCAGKGPTETEDEGRADRRSSGG